MVGCRKDGRLIEKQLPGYLSRLQYNAPPISMLARKSAPSLTVKSAMSQATIRTATTPAMNNTLAVFDDGCLGPRAIATPPSQALDGETP